MTRHCLLVGLIGSLALSQPGLAAAPPSRYTFPASGTVYDTRTKLTWQRAADANTYTVSAAASYCTGLSLAGAGWRLPTRAELLTLVDPTQINPAIDSTAFPSTPATAFWSSSPYPGPSGVAWNVEFNQGASNGSTDSSDKCRVRCVR